MVRAGRAVGAYVCAGACVSRSPMVACDVANLKSISKDAAPSHVHVIFTHAGVKQVLAEWFGARKVNAMAQHTCAPQEDWPYPGAVTFGISNIPGNIWPGTLIRSGTASGWKSSSREAAQNHTRARFQQGMGTRAHECERDKPTILAPAVLHHPGAQLV